TQIKVDAGAVGAQTIRLLFEFTAYSTGQQCVALVDNGAGVDSAVNPSAIDSGTADDGGSTATTTNETYSGPVFTKFSTFTRQVDVDDLEAGEKVVVRTDVQIACNGSSPTGNMQARIAGAAVLAPTPDAISAGSQTIPFKHVGDIKK